MSRTSDSSSAPIVSGSNTRPASRGPWAIFAWAIVACALLAGSGIVRAIQDRRFAVEYAYLEACPFKLSTLATKVGDWKMVEGGETTLDSLTLRIANATDHVMRVYVDELTGVSIAVLVLFGPAQPVLPHTPQVCYPATGYTATDEPSIRTIKAENGRSYDFRAGSFAKSGGRAMIREISYHSFRLEGPWSPDIAAGRRFPRKNPGIFKVQIQRRVADGERRDHDDPIEKFIAKLMPEIDRRIEEASSDGKTFESDLKGTTSAGPAR